MIKKLINKQNKPQFWAQFNGNDIGLASALTEDNTQSILGITDINNPEDWENQESADLDGCDILLEFKNKNSLKILIEMLNELLDDMEGDIDEK